MILSSPQRHSWLYAGGLLLIIMLSSGNGRHTFATGSMATKLPTAVLLSTDSLQALGGAVPGMPSEIYFNETKSLKCNPSERTPGYITTIFLFNAPYVFGCLSRDTTSYYFSVALSGLNFPNTPVWLANRNNPVKDNASFVITQQGSLLLEDFDGKSVWGSGTDGKNPTGLSLTSQGNLILFDEFNNILWQSFSEPVDLLVPGQFLNPGSSLLAGFSSHVSPTGNFVAVMMEGGLIFYENSTSQALPYYALGYPVVPTTAEDVLTSPCNHSRLVLSASNLTQIQVTPSPLCQAPAAPTELAVSFSSPIVFIRLEPNGVLKGYYPDHKPSYDVLGNGTKGMCGFPNVCGPYGICENAQCQCPGNASVVSEFFNPTHVKVFLLTTNSCSLKVPITCSTHDDTDAHLLLDVERVDYFANDFIGASLLTDSFDTCKSACLSNCSCQAAFYRKNSKQCYLHESVLSMIRMEDDNFVGAIKLQRELRGHKKSETGLIVGLSTASVMAVALLGIWYYFHRRKKGKHSAFDKDDDELLASLPGQPRRFSYKELQAATWEFSQKLGVGGFGSVYKGFFPDGSSVAVKQLENTTRFAQGMKEFRNEVNALSNINHQNLVHLRGFCADSGHCLLVYEYVSNGSLDTWLFQKGAERPGPPLDWKTRLAIAVQTARGLVFLHEQCRNRIVHLDIKPQNILLDENFVPKLSDFGLSRLINEDQDSAVSRMRGTPGYMAPECLVLTDATEKSDVYSFGMVLLEIVSGRKNVDVSRLTVHGDAEGWYFPALASRKLKEGNVLDIIDSNLKPLGIKAMSEATRVLQIAFWCIQDNPSLRPTMGNALLMLEGYRRVRQPPLSFHFGMRFHLSNSISTCGSTPQKKAVENGEHYGEEHKRRASGDQGEKIDVASHPQSLSTSPLSSHPASPLMSPHASPIPQMLSYHSFPHSAFRQPSPRHSPALSPVMSSGTSPAHPAHVTLPCQVSTLPSSPAHPMQVISPCRVSALPFSLLSQSRHTSPLGASSESQVPTTQDA